MRNTFSFDRPVAAAVPQQSPRYASELSSDELQHLLISKYLVKLFRTQGKPDAEELKFYESIGLHLGESGFCLAIFHVVERPRPSEPRQNRSNAEISRDLVRIVKQVIQDNFVYYCSEVDDKVALLMCSLYSGEEHASHYQSLLTQYCTEILTRALSVEGILCSVIIGNVEKGVASIARSFRFLCHEMDFLQYSGRLKPGVFYATALPEINHYQLWLNIAGRAQIFVDSIVRHDARAAMECAEQVILYLSSFRPISNAIFLNNLQSFFDSAVYTFVERGIFSPDTMWSFNISRMIHTTMDIAELHERIDQIIGFFITNHIKYKSPSVQTRILDIRQYILDHVAEYNLSVSSVAHEYGISPSLLSAQFKQPYGQTPSVFIARSRISLVKHYLTNSMMPLEEICLKTGFGSLTTLNRTFKHHTGQTPSQYRKKPPL